MIKSDKLTIGILAPVDAGKTTLSECILYHTGSIRKMGRVDHQDAFLDTFSLEKQRGITIFSKQAVFSLGRKEFTLLDTPGHVDFSAEMERTLQVLDYAILIISAADGVTAYTKTLWGLLKQYRIPTFIFVNKMDQSGVERDKIYGQIQSVLSSECLDLETCDEEEIVVCDEHLLDKHLNGEKITDEDISKLILNRRAFPVFFGSALKNDGTEEFIKAIEKYSVTKAYPDEFGAKVFKITRDDQGNRLTHVKITGGRVKAKEVIEELSEKADRIRIYNGAKFTEPSEAGPGTICAIMGFTSTYCGQNIGCEKSKFIPELTPVLSYRVLLPEGTDAHDMLIKMKMLEEEEPQLHIEWEEKLSCINACLMGKVQTEVLKTMISERFGVDIEFGKGNIVYKETIGMVSEGVGHYEPLRHYSEVHLLLEPLPRGTGIIYDVNVDNDVLKPHWQALILSHLAEKQHKGVLTGSDITDIKITVIAGRDHLKHTEPGDMRQSTYRAVRHGLMRNESILLEPFYDFTLTVPSSMTGRAMSDIQRMYGSFDSQTTEGEYTVITGRGPVSTMSEYHSEVISYTRGEGRFFAKAGGYEECHNSEEVVDAYGYDPEADLENSPGSIFCAHGAGFYVPWNEVEDYMHIQPYGKLKEESKAGVKGGSSRAATDAELNAIFERTYGSSEKRKKPHNNRGVVRNDLPSEYKPPKRKKKTGPPYTIVDGYNVIFAGNDKVESIELERVELIEMLKDYSAIVEDNIIVVFDGYKVKGNPGTVEEHEGVQVVYTKENQTADSYIEKIATDLAVNSEVKVATSDYVEQLIIFGSGARRITSKELLAEIKAAKDKVRGQLKENKRKSGKNDTLKTALEAAMNK